MDDGLDTEVVKRVAQAIASKSGVGDRWWLREDEARAAIKAYRDYVREQLLSLQNTLPSQEETT